MTFTVRFTEEAQQDLQRLYTYILDRDEPDWNIAERALNAIQAAINDDEANVAVILLASEGVRDG